MGISINRQIAGASKIIGGNSFVGSLTLAGGSITPVQKLAYLLFDKVKAAAVAVPQACPNIQNVTGIDLLGDNSGLLITHDVTGLAGGYPVPHIQGGARAHPAPMTFTWGKFAEQVDASQLVIVNNTAGNIDVYVVVYSDS
jgi:hypothetical protein